MLRLSAYKAVFVTSISGKLKKNAAKLVYCSKMEELKNLDICEIIAEAAARIGGMDLVHRTGGWNQRRPTVTRVVVTPDKVRRHLLSSVWAGCLDALCQQDGEAADKAMIAELSLAEMRRRGVPRESIKVREGSFRLKLENSEYRIYRRGKETVACPWPSDLWSVIRIGGEHFADFLQFFDAHVPEIVSEVPAIMETIRLRELEEKRAHMEREIRNTTIRSLFDQYLKPLGLSVVFQLDEDNTVTLDLSRHESARLVIPLEELPERLRDTESILETLIAQSPDIYDQDEGY